MNSQTMSFYQLINKKIIIPKIQRDYAQGRGDDKTKQIRDNFLENIFNALENNKSLNLDFIYGIIDEKDCFIPFDGQQRLTTLFLLYYYLVLRNGKNTNEPKFKNLNNFSYETRISSKDFIEKLVEYMDKQLIGSESNGKSIKENIKNQFWFFDEYLQDSTIAGMLTMLESIEEKCKNKNIECEKLKQILENWCDENKCLIKFEFFPLNDFGLSDELYIKMNARGKALSDFENFKAKFIEKLEKISYQNKIEIAKKMDGVWLDLFWKLCKSNDKEMVKETDKRFLAFFQAVLILLGRKFFENKEKINVRELENYNVLNFLFYLDRDKISFIEKILDNLISLGKVNKPQEHFETITKHFKTIIGIENGEDDNGSSSKISAYDRENFYIDMLILSNDNFSFNNFENSNFAKFQRVAQNIVKNRLINNMNDFLRVLECIDELSKGLNSEDFYKFLKDSFDFGSEREKEIRQQVDEEKRKAFLILQSKEWENAIYKAEKYWYLNGQIDFLLKFTNDDLDSFIKYFESFEKVFPKGNEDEYNEQAIDFRRVLLTKGIYFEMKSKQYHSLYAFNPALRTKIDTWRKCFFDKSSLLKELLDDIKNGKSIQNIIDEYLLDDTQSNNPQYYLIKYKEIWNSYSYIRTSNADGVLGNEIQLAKKLTTNGAAECYTYALYCELKNEPHLSIKYQYSNSSNTQKMGIFKNESNKLLVWGNVKDTEEWHFYIIDKDSIEITKQDKCISLSVNNINEKFQKAKEYLMSIF